MIGYRKVYFYNLPNGKVAPMAFKSGSSSLAVALRRHNEEIFNNTRARGQIGHKGREVLVPFRDPLERFKSSMWQIQRRLPITVDEVLNAIEAGHFYDMHFWTQSSLLDLCVGSSGVSVYRFPENFGALLVDAGLDAEPPHINIAKAKPILSEAQIDRVSRMYRNDFELFECIKTGKWNATD